MYQKKNKLVATLGAGFSFLLTKRSKKFNLSLIAKGLKDGIIYFRFHLKLLK